MDKLKTLFIALGLGALAFIPLQVAQTQDATQYWMKIKAKDKFERSIIANTGVSIDAVVDDYVYAVGSLAEKNAIEKLGQLEVSFALTEAHDFPAADSAFHNYSEMSQKLQELSQKHANIAQLISIGKTHENRDIWAMRISGDLANADQLPGVIMMGGHHAREHLSVELPIMYIEYLLSEYAKGSEKIVSLINNREINIIPAVNPDGLEFDVATGKYQMWRKNRNRNSNGTYGVDLNRNYGFGWGTGGSSKNPSSDTYMGATPFSEPESQAIKKYVEANNNTTILLSIHTYSKLILYPWGHIYEGIENDRDRKVHEVMAQTMAKWNGYTPQQSSELYIASGDTTDWSYGEKRIFSFTFELDPGQYEGGGFYPGAKMIKPVFDKNVQPLTYLLTYADNPYRVIDSTGGDVIIRP